MIRVILLALPLLVSGTLGDARTTVVRAGEHADFTRLTLELPENSEWSIAHEARSARLSIEQPEIDFDITQVYSRIPRSRLVSVSSSDPSGDLLLQLGCTCDVEWFVLPRNLLVIDIKDSVEQPFDTRTLLPLIGQYPLQFADHGNAVRSQPSLRGRFPESVQEPNRSNPGLSSTSGAPTVNPAISGNGLNVSERRLLEQIGRATRQGLLTPVAPIPADVPVSTREPDASVTTRTSNRPPPINVVAATSVDRGLMNVASSLPLDSGIDRCLDPALVDIQDWGEDGHIAEQIGSRRAALYGALDQLDIAAARALARTYLYFGFGAEARDMLKLLSTDTPETAVMKTMAQIVDDEHVPEANPFVGQENCDASVVLWSLLAKAAPVENVDATKLQQAFVNLPDHLRVLFGPRLGETLARAGEPGLAATILRTMDRTGTVQGPGKDYSDAIVKKSSGNTPQALEQLDEVIRSDSEYSPKALAELVESNWLERIPLTPETVELAAAYATELRDSDEGADARRALAIALALNGRYDSAVETLSDIGQRDEPDSLASAAAPVMTLVAENADDVTFLRLGFANMDLLQRSAAHDLQEKTARRLLDIGFPQAAINLLNSEGTSASRQRILMRAEAAIDLGLPHRALVSLLSVPGSKADELRARAMQKSGDYRLAGQALLDANMVEESARWLWLGDALDIVPPEDESLYAQVAKLTTRLDRDGPDADVMPPLAGARAMLSDSEEIRGEISELMKLVPAAVSGQ